MRKGGCCKEKDQDSTDQGKKAAAEKAAAERNESEEAVAGNSMRNGVNSSQNANSSSGAEATFDFPLGISLGLLSLTKIF